MEFLENEFHLSLVRERLRDLITLPEHSSEETAKSESIEVPL